MVKFILILLVLTGCVREEPLEVHEEHTEVMLYETHIEKTPFSFFTINHNYITSKFEPIEGVYLGAYIRSNRYPLSNIEVFEELVGRRHALFTHKMELGDPFPEEWILECIALQRTPNIILTHGNEISPFETHKLVETAKQFGSFRTPMLLHFFPHQRQHGYNPEQYIDFFRLARKVFAEHAPNIAFVFTISEHDILDSYLFYPGDDYVDWVGIDIFKNISENGNPFTENTLSRLNAFYHTHSQNKPIIISGFGVSHFSTMNHIYHPVLAGEAIENFYRTILINYPRVKAIVYMDINSIAAPTNMHNRDNFSITADSTVLNFYRNVIQNDLFLSYVEFDAGGDIIPQFVKSPFTAYRINDSIYISENILIYEFKKSNIAQFENYRLELHGDTYYNLAVLETNNIHNIYVDVQQSRIIIN